MGFELKWDGGTKVGWAEFELPAPGARLGINLIMAREVTDLPDPDSPTSPRVLPLGMDKLRFLTA